MVVKCKELTYTPVNALTFKITGGTKSITPHKVNNIIQSLESPDGIIQTLGVRADIKGIKYKANIIEEKWRNKILTYEVSCAQRTKSSIFVLPMLGGNRNLYFWNQLFLNCFIATDKDKDCIVLAFRFSSDPLFIKFEKALSTFKYFRKRYDPSPDYVMFVFDIPKQYIKDFDRFINGKYSELSKLYKINILDFHNLEINGEVGQILFKSPRRKKILEKKIGAILNHDSELLSIIDKDKEETFNFETYKFKKIL